VIITPIAESYHTRRPPRSANELHCIPEYSVSADGNTASSSEQRISGHGVCHMWRCRVERVCLPDRRDDRDARMQQRVSSFLVSACVL